MSTYSLSTYGSPWVHHLDFHGGALSSQSCRDSEDLQKSTMQDTQYRVELLTVFRNMKVGLSHLPFSSHFLVCPGRSHGWQIELLAAAPLSCSGETPESPSLRDPGSLCCQFEFIL